jgi:hypothetical protein
LLNFFEAREPSWAIHVGRLTLVGELGPSPFFTSCTRQLGMMAALLAAALKLSSSGKRRTLATF